MYYKKNNYMCTKTDHGIWLKAHWYTLAYSYKKETVPFSFPNGKSQTDNSINTPTCFNSYWF